MKKLNTSSQNQVAFEHDTKGSAYGKHGHQKIPMNASSKAPDQGESLLITKFKKQDNPNVKLGSQGGANLS